MMLPGLLYYNSDFAGNRILLGSYWVGGFHELD